MIAPGELFADRFRVIKHAEDGGSAAVFRAFDEKNNVLVALKVFNPDTTASGIAVELWNREGSALQKLSHAAVVKLIDIGRCARTDHRYIATEWVEGKTLQETLTSSGALDWTRFNDLFGAQLLDVLCHLYESNVSHRDISPKNVLVDPAGQLKLIDFGLAKLSDVGIGQTVAGWKTPPYAPPEEDTGRHTLTRDSYAFAAIAVRALHGRDIADHDELYDALDGIPLADEIKSVLRKALLRDPKGRYENVSALRDALSPSAAALGHEHNLAVLAIRFLPSAFKLDEPTPEAISLLEASILAELNDACAVRLLAPSETPSPTRLEFETTSYRLGVDIATAARNHLVVVYATEKRFSIDGIYRRGRWQPDIKFVTRLPRTHRERQHGEEAVSQFYRLVERELAQVSARIEPRGDAFLDQWQRVLEAMKEMERTRLPAAPFTFVEVVGNRLFVKLERSSEVAVGEFRAISRIRNGRWVFRGQVESIDGDQCCLYSAYPFIATDEIPGSGLLDHDWSREQRALERQATALERFRTRSTPSDRLRQLVLMEEAGAAEADFANVPQFFNKDLNDEKKALVSRFMASKDLLLIHGPPGTGKTKVIVELVRQELSRRASSKILLVSQTHVALDHALKGVVEGDPSISAIRISSGSREMGDAVKHCSVESRGDQLSASIARSSESFLRAQAASSGLNYDELLLGVRAKEVLDLRRKVKALSLECEGLERQLEELRLEQERNDKGGSTRQHDEAQAKRRGLRKELDKAGDELSLTKSQVRLSEQSLSTMGKQAKELIALADSELHEWCSLFLDGPGKQRLRELVELAEEWRLRFPKSDDFRAAIIAQSRVVAGTCVGFSGEAAATVPAYDLCIVDESSKATTTELLLPLSRAQRAVLVGDHLQLPPFVEFALRSDAVISRFGFSKNILEAQLFEALQEKLAEGQKGRLKQQYRMRGAIGSLVSQCFYDGELTSDLKDDETAPFADLSLAGLKKRVTWYDTQRKGASAYEQPCKPSFSNPGEVRTIVSLLKRLKLVLSQRKGPSPTIGVISGYAEQVSALHKEVRKQAELSDMAIECSSVHTFQGREVDICIYSVTRNNPHGDLGFLSDWKHLNVALSRARWHLVIVGSVQFCSTSKGDNPFKPVVEFVSRESACEIKDCPDD